MSASERYIEACRLMIALSEGEYKTLVITQKWVKEKVNKSVVPGLYVFNSVYGMKKFSYEAALSRVDDALRKGYEIKGEA